MIKMALFYSLQKTLRFTSLFTFIFIISISSALAQVEICSNGVDDDGDGLIDCDDSDCVALITCQDTDNDDIIDIQDSDNDNDGIIDYFEGYMMEQYNTSIIQWLHLNNDATQDGYLPNFPVGDVAEESETWNDGNGANPTYISSQGGSETVGSGITRNIVENMAVVSGVDQCCLQDAITDNDYLEYSFTTASGYGKAFLYSHSMMDNLTSGSSQSWTEHHRSIFISYDDFATFENLTQDYLVEQSSSSVPEEIEFYNKNVQLQENTTYKVRIYFYASVNGNNAQVDDFGLLLNQRIELDHDGDGTPSYYDTDADGDGCLDIDEGKYYAFDPGSCFTGYEICDDGIDNDLNGLTDCADPACGGNAACPGAFACESGLYQVLSGQLNEFNAAQLNYTAIGSVNPSYNGAGYNISDGYMYGQRKENGARYIFRIFNDGSYENIGEVTGGSVFPNYIGDIDANNNLVSYKNGTLYYVDLTQSSPMSYTTQSLTNVTGGSNPSCHDIVYNAVYEDIYLITPSVELWLIDVSESTLTRIADLSSSAPGISGANGAIWSDALGKLYFFNNSSGNIYYVTLNSTGNAVIDAGFLVAGTSNGNNDGMSCPLALIPEICGNGLDDDGDSLIDCDDPDCSESNSCDYSNARSGSTGGLESNSRLAAKIAKRNFERTKTNTMNIKTNTQERRIVKGQDHPMVGFKSGENLSDFIPLDIIPNSETFVSTPGDLIDITNATEVMSVDYFVNDERLGSVLATSTVDGVYEHTKYICDRVHGARIENIWNYKMDGKNEFIITKFFHPTGEAEYASSFSIFDQGGTYQLESHWNVADYTENDQFYNFQVWADNPSNLETIVENILAAIQVQAPIEDYNCGKAPNLFVEQLSYENHVLTMDIINKPASLTVDASGNTLETEVSNSEEVGMFLDLSGARKEQISVDMDGIYGLGMTLNHDNMTVPDAIYYADGSWGLDYSEAEATVNDFEIIPEGDVVFEDGYKIERNVEVAGSVTGKMSVYRSLNAAYRAVNMSEYNTLSFRASGDFVMEVTLVKEGIENWEDQMHTSVMINKENQRVELPLARFFAPEGQQDWSDLKMIVFSVVHNNEERVFELGISNVMFSNKEHSLEYADLLEGGSYIYPNPVTYESKIVFGSDEYTSYTYRLFNATGQQISEINGEAVKGINEITIFNDNYPAGMYMYEVSLNNGKPIQGKVMMSDRE